MTATHPPHDRLDAKAVIGAPVAAFLAVLGASIACSLIAGTIPAVSEATGQSIPFFLGALLLTLGAFGGLPAGEISLTLGTVGFTFVIVPLLFTALAAFILYKVHRASELSQPLPDTADRIVAGACSGMVLLVCCVLAWFAASLLNPDSSRASLTSNVFILAAGALLVGTVFSAAGRNSTDHRRPAWMFTMRYALATGMPVAIVVCIVMTVSFDWGSSAWLLLGNMVAAIWVGIHGGLLTWQLDLAPLGGPSTSGTGLIIAASEGPWTIIGLPLGAVAIIFATLAWRRECLSQSKWALPCAFAVITAVSLVAGSWFSGYIRVGADTSRLSAMLLLSPFNIAIMGAIGCVIDRLARLMVGGKATAQTAAPNHSANRSKG